MWDHFSVRVIRDEWRSRRRAAKNRTWNGLRVNGTKTVGRGGGDWTERAKSARIAEKPYSCKVRSVYFADGRFFGGALVDTRPCDELSAPRLGGLFGRPARTTGEHVPENASAERCSRANARSCLAYEFAVRIPKAAGRTNVCTNPNNRTVSDHDRRYSGRL